MSRQVSQSEFDKIKSALGQSESAVKEVKISQISVDGDSLRKGQIYVGGVPVSVGPDFFSRLGSMLRLNVSLTRQMLKEGDHSLAAVLINGLKDYAASRRIDSVLLIANVGSRQIVDMCEPKRFKRVTNSTLFDVTERLLNEHSGLVVETVDVNPFNGTASINLLNSNEIGFAQAGRDEFFKFGFSIIQSTKDTIVESYNTRLVCSNGLRVSFGSGAIGGDRSLNFEDRFRLGGTSAEDIKIFLNRIEEMKKADFVPGGFSASINKAVTTKASLAEVEAAMRMVTGKVEEVDPDLKNGFRSALVRNYFEGYGDTMARIHQKGKDPKELVARQKQFIKTSQSVWDVVNSLTYLGSNDSGIPLENKHELKSAAGELFSKGVKDGFDLEFSQYATL